MRLAHRGTAALAFAAPAILGLVALACGDTHTLGVGGPGGTAGTGSVVMPIPAGDGSQQPGSPGSPGAGQVGNPGLARPPTITGGSGAVPSAPPGVRFEARLEGDLIVVDVESSIDLSTLTCSAATALEKFDPANNAWTALHDDRYAWNQNPGYYLDDTFVPSMFNLGCDVVFCTPLPGSSEHVLVEAAYEYVKTGTAAPPPGFGDVPVDVIERRPLSGNLRIRIDYFEDGSCQTPSRVFLELFVPAEHEGVCCPIGIAQCSTEGPLGGWAPSLDACPPYEMAWDVSFEQRVDPRGCPVLVEEPDVCCGCVPDADGGV